MCHIKNFEDRDLREVIEVYKENSDFPFPDLNSCLYPVRKIVTHKGKIIGFGLLKLTSEAILILDLKQPRTRRAKAIKKLIEASIEDGEKLGLDDTHVFLLGREANIFEQFLKKNFNFVNASGKAMFWRSGNGKGRATTNKVRYISTKDGNVGPN